MMFLYDFFADAVNVWNKGGLLMPVIGLLSFYTYFVAIDLWLRLQAVIPKNLQAFPREKWSAFQGGGKVDRIIRYCVADHKDASETRRRFAQVREADSSFLSRRIKFLFVLAEYCTLSRSPRYGYRDAQDFQWLKYAR